MIYDFKLPYSHIDIMARRGRGRMVIGVIKFDSDGLKKINYFSILPRKFELFRILSNFDVGQGVRAIVLNPTFNTFNNS
jgi:hypothetical protein